MRLADDAQRFSALADGRLVVRRFMRRILFETIHDPRWGSDDRLRARRWVVVRLLRATRSFDSIICVEGVFNPALIHFNFLN